MEDQNTGTNPVQDGNGPQSGSGTTPQQPVGSDGRTFTQDQVNEIIKQRLAKYGDYDDLRSYKQQSEEARLTEVERLSKQLKDLAPFKETAARQSAILEDIYNSELEAVPDEYKSLIPEDFDTLTKLQYLRKNKGVFFKTPTAVPNTPIEPNRPVSKPGLYGGKFENLVDFQAKDPKGYSIWRRSQGL